MECITCPGLPASWVNAWLAAVGATQLDERIRLHWTRGYTPVAVFSADGVHPVEALVSSWPTSNQILELPLASDWRGLPPIRRKVKVEDFATRTRAARDHPQSWTLSSTMTDLGVDRNGEVTHAPFDPAGPGTIKWLHHRLMKLHRRVTPSAAAFEESLSGRGIRIEDNGLGFDHARLGSLADGTDPIVDPVIEILVFFGLSLLPVRGSGHDERLGSRARMREVQRGWTFTQGKGATFSWPAWGQPLGFHGIDAVLDVWKPGAKNSWERLGVHAGWRTVRYGPRGSSDSTRAFGSQRL